MCINIQIEGPWELDLGFGLSPSLAMIRLHFQASTAIVTTRITCNITGFLSSSGNGKARCNNLPNKFSKFVLGAQELRSADTQNYFVVVSQAQRVGQHRKGIIPQQQITTHLDSKITTTLCFPSLLAQLVSWFIGREDPRI